ncbi:hypothetical protein FOZG_01766 [Fusarium oxysporum Fo47]|uniref:Uncharacterized protein n=1 Tax=Fusarium oxysporum Fo47 TaxID=660027 RepID=W9L545_FUSOX|nr:hypothetical protein FOZG_01766 [Fusarium oxysporum Fo47]
MARASDLSWVWGWLPLDDKYEWDSIFTIDEAFDNKHYNITFAAISVLYKILKAISIILVPIAILLGHWLASLAVLILSVVRLSILVLILKVFGDGFESHQEVVRPFFSTRWNIGECLSMSSLLTYFPMIRFRACQAIEIVREHLVSIRDELYEITGIDFRYPDLPDGDVTHIQPSDTRAERWMRQLVQEDRIRRRRGIENERISGHDVIGNQQESLDGGPETPAARTNPHDSDEEMGSFEPGAAGDPGVSSKEEQTPLASTIYDAQMADVWRPNEEESKRIGDAAQNLFKDLMDQDDEDSSEDTKPEREPSMSPMREIVTEDQQANLEDTPMQDMQSSAPPAITAGLHLPIQQPEGPRVQAQPFISPESRPIGQGMSPREEAKLADMLVAAFEEHGPDTPTQDAQPPSVRPQPLTSADPLLEAFRARLTAAETEPQPDKYYAQVPKDRGPLDPVKEATADQRAN